MERKSMTGSFFWDHVRTEMDVGTKKTQDNEQVDRTASESAIERLCTRQKASEMTTMTLCHIRL